MPAGSLATVEPREHQQPWEALIERTARGDESALSALYDGTVSVVHGLALRILGDAAVAEEVTLDVYMQVWRQAVQYDSSRGAPLSWLLTVARSRAIDRRRAGASQRAQTDPLPATVGLVSTAPGPEEDTSIAERRRIVQGALTRLPAEQRQAVEMAYFTGLSHSEIAAALAEPLGTVKTRIRIGLSRLRDALAGLGGQPL